MQSNLNCVDSSMSCPTSHFYDELNFDMQASVTLLERLPVVLEKSSEHDLHHFILPLLFNALDSKMSQIQVETRMQLSLRYDCKAELYLGICENIALFSCSFSRVLLK